jgi:signal peptidase I
VAPTLLTAGRTSRETSETASHEAGTRRGEALHPWRPFRVAVFCVLVALATDAWLVQGLLVPVIVASGSMSPALLGPHRQWRCAACDRAFVSAIESLPPEGEPAICPNCGAKNDESQAFDRPGQRVLIDRASFLLRGPRRWETVVFRSAEEPAMLCVKRVVGLPGETVEIRQGDVLIDGRVAAKDPAQARTMAVVVHEMTPPSDRWQAPVDAERHVDTGWHVDARGATYRASRKVSAPAASHAESVDRIDWLSYRHVQGFSPRNSPSSAAIVDESPCDQSESRTPSIVTDVTLRCRLQASGAGDVCLRADSRGDVFTARINVMTGLGELVRNQRRVAAIHAPSRPFRTPARVELMLVDRQVLLAIGERPLVQFGYVPSASGGGQPQALAIGGGEADLQVSELAIFRDVFYTPCPNGKAAKHRLGANEFYVLGDNSPHALDSRAGAEIGPVRGDQILGKAVWW